MRRFARIKCRKMFLEASFSHWRKLFPKFPYKIFVIVLKDIIGLQNFSFLSANYNPELRCVIYTGVTLFALVLHLNCTALSQSGSSVLLMIYYMANVCSQYNTRSDWLSEASRQGIILPITDYAN